MTPSQTWGCHRSKKSITVVTRKSKQDLHPLIYNTIIQPVLPENCASSCRVFHRFGQAKFAYGGLVLGLSQFLLLPQPPQKMTLTSKVVKINSKIII